jgi:hypothetical protein
MKAEAAGAKRAATEQKSDTKDWRADRGGGPKPPPFQQQQQQQQQHAKAFSDAFGAFDFQRQIDSEWKNAKIAANMMKFCPGESCREYLPLYHFASNANMVDGLDIYCSSCNAKRREERKYRTMKKVNNAPLPDLFEKSKASTESEDPVFREIHKRINTAIKEAQMRFKKKMPIDPSEISRHLFLTKKVFCKVSGAPLTPACFLDHHSIVFEITPVSGNKCKAEVICSNTLTFI